MTVFLSDKKMTHFRKYVCQLFAQLKNPQFLKIPHIQYIHYGTLDIIYSYIEIQPGI